MATIVTFFRHTAENWLLFVDRVTTFLWRRAPLEYCKVLSLVIALATFDTVRTPPPTNRISYDNPTPPAHADASRDVFPRGGTSHPYLPNINSGP
ncbi:hypothetical protein TNCV_1366301 [Trichonephila clavipes]|nr:hypothetical protein TNCV_1366301 [Trichonephila clavipes]